MSRRLYFDHNASAPPAPGTAAAVAHFWAEEWGNPSSVHSEGRRARAAVERARTEIAEAAGAAPADVVFASGGSEANALAVRGLVDAGLVKTLVVWSLEHASTLQTAHWLASRGLVELRTLKATRKGQVETAEVAKALEGAELPLVSVMLAQNEIGTINNIPAIVRLARGKGALVHTDAVQVFGKVGFSFKRLGVDLLTISAHKVGGPQGVGALIARPELFPVSFCLGGGQEEGRRQGTEAAASIVGFGAAAAGLRARLAAEAKLAPLRDRLERTVADAVEGTLVLGFTVPRLPNTSAIVFKHLSGADVAAECDRRGLAVSAGSACHAGGEAPSPVAAAVGLPSAHRRGLVRVSLGPETTAADAEQAASILIAAAQAVRARG